MTEIGRVQYEATKADQDIRRECDCWFYYYTPTIVIMMVTAMIVVAESCC